MATHDADGGLGDGPRERVHRPVDMRRLLILAGGGFAGKARRDGGTLALAPFLPSNESEGQSSVGAIGLE